MELYPDVKLGIGPPIDTGFFYEFLRDEPFTQEDLVTIEKKMHELAAQDLPNERKLIPKPEAARPLQEEQPDFQMRACGGKKPPSRWFRSTPLESSSTSAAARIFLPPSAFKHQVDERRRRVLEGPGRQSPAPANLRGGFLHTKSWTRICTASKKPSAAITASSAGRTRPLQHSEEAGRALIFWHPKGGLIRTIVESWLRDELLKRGYDLVYTPHIMRSTSGRSAATRIFTATTCSARRSRESRLPAQAHELPWAHSDLQIKAPQLPRPARPPRRARHRLIATNAAASFTACSASAASPKTTRTFSACPRKIESEVEACVDFAFAVMKIFGFDKFRSRAFRLGSRASGELRRQARRLASRHGRSRRHHEAHELPVQKDGRRSRLLRPEDRRKTHRRYRRSWQLTTVQFDFFADGANLHLHRREPSGRRRP